MKVYLLVLQLCIIIGIVYCDTNQAVGQGVGTAENNVQINIKQPPGQRKKAYPQQGGYPRGPVPYQYGQYPGGYAQPSYSVPYTQAQQPVQDNVQQTQTTVVNVVANNNNNNNNMLSAATPSNSSAT